MKRWDEHHVSGRRIFPDSGLADGDETRGVVGVGLARVLGLCGPLKLRDCPPRPATATLKPSASVPALVNVADLDPAAEPPSASPRLDLLAATAAGAPNVVSLFVSRAEPQAARELDDNLVVMNFALAQKLLYGRGEQKATGIVVQLHRTEDLRSARARLSSLFKERGLDLEIRDFAEREPFYKQAVGMFTAILLFIALVMGVIVVFTVVNTMSMTVMERTSEIGTVRALGSRRSGVRGLFVIEGAALGIIGATVGVLAGQALALLFNHSGAMWTPPGQAAPTPLQVMTSGAGMLLLVAWLSLVAIAALASLIPANRASKLQIVEALRHV
jgi:putative ABC transport system permease protein